MAEQTSDDPYQIEVQRVRRQLEVEGRSENLLRLFDYLLAHSQDVRAPKEIEIAFEVFGKDVRYDTSQDAMVRVYVHRLRGRIDEIYEGAQGSRLVIPKGEYRIILAEKPVLPASASRPRNPLSHSGLIAGLSLRKLAAFAFVTTALGWGALFYLRHRSDAPRDPAIDAYREAEKGCGAPLLVAGDSYLYFQSNPADRSRRLIMRPTITSAAQLDAVSPGETAKGDQIRDLDDYYISADGADGLWSLLWTQSGQNADKVTVPAVLPNSKLTPEALNGGNVIYFGRLDQLARLHDVVFHASRFTFDPVSDTLSDPANGQDYNAPLNGPTDENDRDPSQRPAVASGYGYLARIAKPNGCAVWIVAGLEDSVLPQMARIAGDPARLEALFRQSQGSPSFEALYEIRSLGALKYESRLILARPLETAP